MALRNLLYISPYFPPQSRVGALRPLKFTRYLSEHGWRAVVLADLTLGDAVDPALNGAVGPHTIVLRDYGWFSPRTERVRVRHPASTRGGKPRSGDWLSRLGPLGPARNTLGRWLTAANRIIETVNPELVPLGHHSLDLPHAVAAALRALARHPCEAILVNADPYAAVLVGAAVAHRSGLPLLLDFRDPWAPCELRRPLRPPPQRRIVDWLERFAVERAARVILNTENARAAYVAHYSDLPEERFVALRNHADPELVAAPSAPAAREFTLLYLGHLRRFVEGDALFDLLAELRRRGHGPEQLRLHVVGTLPESVRDRASARGVLGSIVAAPPVPYLSTGGTLLSADLLVAIGHEGQQRIPAKLYEYLAQPRPVLALSDNHELAALVERAESAWARRLDDPRGAADVVEAVMTQGRQLEVQRSPLGITSREATATLAAWLDAVSAART